MNNSLAILGILLITISSCFSSKDTSNKKLNVSNDSAQVSILGLFHFEETGDLSAIQMEDVASVQRQTEIEELVKKLQSYNPTKILVEYPAKKGASLNEEYDNYRLNKKKLGLNEIEQVGFRLAKEMNHDSIYSIDHKLDLPYSILMEFCEKEDKMSDFENLAQEIGEFGSNESKKLSKTNLSSYLYKLNSIEKDRFINELYINEMLEFVTEENDAGAEVSAHWYKRNLLILKNIANEINNPNERLLVIIGSGHRAILRGLVKERTDMKYVEIQGYLK